MPNKGRGVFNTAPIKSGAIVWRYVTGQYAVFDEESLRALLLHLPDSEARYVLTHIHCMPEFPDFMVWVFDEGALINHADLPTLTTHTGSGFNPSAPLRSTEEVKLALQGDHFTLIAARDIDRGEELTLDYNADPSDPPYYDALCERYGVTWDWL